MKKISVVRVVMGKPPHTPQTLKALNESGMLDITREAGEEVDGVIFYEQFVDNGPQVFAGQSSVEVQIALFDHAAQRDMFEMGPDSTYVIVVLRDALHLPDDADMSTWETFTSAVNKAYPLTAQSGSSADSISDHENEIFFPPASGDDYN